MRGAEVAGRQPQNLVLVGANGMLAQAVKSQAPDRYRLTCLDLPEFDLTSRDQVVGRMRDIAPAVIVNCAAYTHVDGCETNEETATTVNGLGPGHLAQAALEIGATLVHISTDYVFDGKKDKPYVEEDPTGPLSAYGRSKLRGERAILESGLVRYFILRTSWLYGPGGKNFVETILRLAAEREELRIVADQVGCPTLTLDLAEGIFRLLDLSSAPYGIYHFANEGSCSWHEFACEIVKFAREESLQVKARHIEPIETEDYPLPATRPAYSVLSKEKYKQATGAEVPGWKKSLEGYFKIR